MPKNQSITTTYRVPVFVHGGDVAIDLVDISRAYAMRRHAGRHAVWLKRDKQSRQVVAVILSYLPALSDRDWREPHRHVDSNFAIRKEEISRDASYHCKECGHSHGGMMRGAPTVSAHKAGMITNHWRRVLQHEMKPLYR